MNPNVFSPFLKIKIVDTKNFYKTLFSRTFNRLSVLPLTLPLCLVLVLGTGNVWGQAINEGFESGLPTSYNSTLSNITLGSGTWQIKDVIAGTTGVNGGLKSAQIRSATAAQIITPSIVGGIGSISFYVTGSTASGAYQVNISTDNGVNWTPAPGSPFSIGTTKTLKTINVNSANVNKVQIYRTGATIYIDDFITSIYSATNNTVTFDANGGTGTMSNQSASSATALTSNTFTRTGYTFAGWNTAANGSGTAYADGASFPFTANTTLYAQWTANSSNNCPSGTSISPTTDQTVCQDISTSTIATTVSYSGGTGTPTDSYQWYYNTTNSNTISGATAVSGATSASFSPPSSSNEVGTRYYFCVAYATDNSCAQSATTQSLASSTVKIVVNGIPAAPSGTSAQTFCSGNTVANLNATGTAIQWYSASLGGSALNSSSALTSTDYYASQTVNGCESSNRLAVAATVNTIPAAPTGTAAQTFCSGNTVSNLNATGTAIKWYSASSGGSALTGTSALLSTSYYASQTVSGCESSNRLAVAATVNSISIPTNLVSSNANCSGFDLAWDAVNCASGYKLDVSENRDFLETKKYENFAGLTSSGGTLDISPNLDNYTFYSGWSGSKVYVDLNQAKLGTGTAAGNIVTPSIDYSTLGSGSISFKAKTFGSDASIIQLFISTDNGITYTQIGSDYTLSSSFLTYNVIFTTTSNSVKFKIAAKTSSNCRFYLDDVYTYGANYLSGYQDLSVSATSKTVSGLSPNTKYYYRVRSTDGTNTSASSIVDSVTTPVLSFTTDGIIAPFCFGTATSSSLTYTAANDNPNSYSIDWNATANTVGLNDQAATSFTSSASGGTISSIAISSNVPAGTYSGVMTITNTAGCSITKNVSLTINALPTISIAASPSSAIVCSGSNVSLTASGASTYSWSGGISNGSSFSVTSPTSYTVTGTDANGCSATASKTVNYYPASSNVILASASVSGAVEQCTESDGYTYYADPASPGQYLFGINKNGNSFSATVDITVDNVNKFKKSTSSNGANQEHASYILSRFWNVNATGTISNPVKVRFFIEPQDISDLLDARDDDLDTLKINNPSTKAVISGFEWFKTSGISYNPSSWNGNKFNSTLVKLTEDTVATINGQWYVELSGITSFSGGTGGAAFGPSSNNLFNSSGIVGLPVTWKEVNAIAKEMGNQIQWATSSEKNTKSFEVEYSYDAKNFIIASKEIKAAGNSSTTNSYEYTHLEEFGEMLYYRIKQIDWDGKVDYSKIVNVKRTSKLPAFQVSMYPIPLNVKDLNIRIQTVQKTNIAIIINDLLGRSVYTETISPTGYTTDQKLDLSHLTQGTYYVTIDNGVNKTVQVLLIRK